MKAAPLVVLPSGLAAASPAHLQRTHRLVRPVTAPQRRLVRRSTVAAGILPPWTRLLEPGPADAQEEDPGTGGDGSSGESGGGEGADEMAHSVDEVYENQRFFGLAWSAPLSLLDWPEWSDGQGYPVALARRPPDDPGAWEAVAAPATDAEGWQYATVFKHLEYKRAGGRAVRRFNDTVRRRLWRRRPGTSSGVAPAVAVPTGGAGPMAAAQAAAAGAAAASGARSSTGAAAVASGAAMAAAEATREAREAEARRQAIKAFVGLIVDLLSRRQLWTLVPWDPAAVFLLWQKHQKVYQELQAQAYERRLFTADQEAPPSQLRKGRTLLQDLICAAMHSRAAYGFPAAAGMMSTVTDYIRLQTIQPLTFDAVGGVSIEANNESVAALAGIAVEDLLLAEWRNSPYRPCHYVAIDRANQCVVISIRGTLQLGDLLSDLHAAPMEVEIAGADGWVHQGIFSAATFIHCNTQEALHEAATRCPGWPVLITGHSLGGGTAALLTLLLQEAGLPKGLGPLRCITMGTAAVMSQPLAAACNELVTSVILGSDVVPHLSYASVEHLLLEASEESPVRRTVQGWGTKLAGALNKGAAKQQEGLQAAAAALNSSKIAGSWAAVRQASQLLSQTASGTGLNRLASLVAEGTSLVSGEQQQQQRQEQQVQGARRIPVLEQQQEPMWQQQAQQSQQKAQLLQPPRQIPVLDLSRQQQAEQAHQHQQHQQQPADPPAAAAVASQQQETDVVVPLSEFDSPAVETAMALESAAAAAAGQGGTLVAAGGGVQEGPGNPELLYPPGRIIWIFPTDEHLLAPIEAEEQLQAMDAAWQGAAGPLDEYEAAEGMQQDRQPQPQPQQQGARPPGAAPQQQQQNAAAAAAGPRLGGSSTRGQYELTNEDAEVQGHGAVNAEEAMEAVETGHRHADEAGQGPEGARGGDDGVGAGSSGPAGSDRRRPPVAVDADRSCFERLLLMPDMLNDHLPDRIVAALQQL